MNRRIALSVLSGAAAVGFASTSRKVLAQGADIEGVKTARNAFYAALATLDDGTAMEKVWAKRPYVTFIGPRSKSVVVGAEAVKKTFAENNKIFAERKITLTNEHLHVVGNLAWEMGYETGETKTKEGRVTKVDNFVTGIYEKIDGRWFRVSHHAQPRPQ